MKSFSSDQFMPKNDDVRGDEPDATQHWVRARKSEEPEREGQHNEDRDATDRNG